MVDDMRQKQRLLEAQLRDLKLDEIEAENKVAYFDPPERRKMKRGEILAQANELASEFYKLMGYEIESWNRFYDWFRADRHPQEIICWGMACAAFEMLLGIELDQIVSELEDESEQT